MPIAQVEIETATGSRSADLAFLDRHGYGVCGRESALAYLHRVRHLPDDAWDRRGAEAFYRKHVLPKAPALLANLLVGRTFGIVLTPPSTRHDAKPYLQAIQRIIGPIDDWSSCFTRVEGASAGRNPSWQSLAAALTFLPKRELANVSSVLLVDDQFSSGTTASAVLDHLQRVGALPTIGFVIAAPLWVVPKPQRGA